MRAAVIALFVVAATAGPALANAPSMTSPGEPAQELPPGPQKSPSTAQGLSIVGALLGPVLTMVGSRMHNSHPDAAQALVWTGGAIGILGPSTGHWYAGKVFTKGLGLRVLGTGAAIAGVVLAISCEDSSSCPKGALGAAMVVGGVVSYVVGTIWDVVTADDTARAWNRGHTGTRVEPMPIATAGGVGVGLALAGDF